MSNLYNILKAHESEVIEIAEENKMNFGGPVALVSKMSVKDDESDDEAKQGEEVFLMNFDDEVVAYYSNNRVKKVLQKVDKWEFQEQLREETDDDASVSQK